ncbi:RNA polymerase sigma-70 factor, ECF subfamily [Nocardioides alpinus]|uniref:RNA polymerase sigma-70 factor, ECF subfamily n=1 Tax=Nocardioides alpinus TaxID=748909 RepID=A0A1I0V979_9ACTN|nr:sigma-70 family RNA polymerase sigma factor [Nocardioides alpinus]PKH37102.1 RNA polymerase subunit sigma-24 [Nocardioides alpinus]SFA72136.1 RNA polymerase sigma-70 factor, ECF subfamily [Nocardioides alpinus]
MPGSDAELAELVRESGRDVLATLVRQVGDLELAQDAVQDAVVRALETWARDGVPPSPVAWLRVTARRRAIDLLRQARSRGAREERAVAEDPELRGGWTDDLDPGALQDDLLRLLFTCCHPSLAPAGQVALALRTLCGLTEAEIARALLSTPDAVAKRLVRTRRKIKVAGIPYVVPPDHELPDRWEGVLTTVHLVFNEGYAATSGSDLTRPALVAEAVRLARLLVALQPDDAAALGLLALMLLQDSRHAARLDDDGRAVLLADQDRSLWDTALIHEGVDLVGAALRRSGDRPHRFVVQAALAACHALAPRWEDTDWAAIVSWYDLLLVVDPSPVVALNRAVAIGELAGPAPALALLDQVAGLDGYAYWHASRAVVLRRLGREVEAAAADRRAAALPVSEPVRRILDPD